MIPLKTTYCKPGGESELGLICCGRSVLLCGRGYVTSTELDIKKLKMVRSRNWQWSMPIFLVCERASNTPKSVYYGSSLYSSWLLDIGSRKVVAVSCYDANNKYEKKEWIQSNPVQRVIKGVRYGRKTWNSTLDQTCTVLACVLFTCNSSSFNLNAMVAIVNSYNEVNYVFL